MTTRTLVHVSMTMIGGCAARAVWLDTYPTVEDYTSAKVRIYRAGQHCRLEVTTPTETIITLPTRCAIVPRRVTP
jgi:hypothetical protein